VGPSWGRRSETLSTIPLPSPPPSLPPSPPSEVGGRGEGGGMRHGGGRGEGGGGGKRDLSPSYEPSFKVIAHEQITKKDIL